MCIGLRFPAADYARWGLRGGGAGRYRSVACRFGGRVVVIRCRAASATLVGGLDTPSLFHAIGKVGVLFAQTRNCGQSLAATSKFF